MPRKPKCAMLPLCTLMLLLVCLPWSAQAQFYDPLQAARLAGKPWKILQMTKHMSPQPVAEVLLEAPDRQREKLTLQGEATQKLVLTDVIAFEHDAKRILSSPPDTPLKFHRVGAGSLRWTMKSWYYRLK